MGAETQMAEGALNLLPIGRTSPAGLPGQAWLVACPRAASSSRRGRRAECVGSARTPHGAATRRCCCCCCLSAAEAS